MIENNRPENSTATKQRFERDAAAFNAIYEDNSEFSSWFNKTFRKPIFERYDTAFEVMGDLQNKSVLDVGCGSGVYSTRCALKGAQRVKGIDFSKPMLALAQARAASQNVSNCEFVEVDFLAMSTDEKFDFSLAMGVFDYLSNPKEFLQKLKVVTRGKIIASFPGYSLVRAPLRKLRYLMTSKGRVFFYTRQDIEILVKQVGFSRVEIRTMQTGSGFVLIASC